MIGVKSLTLKNVPLFSEDTVLEFRKGLTVVYGLNQASSKNSRNGNAAGKSALVSQIQDILNSKPSIGTVQDRLKEGHRSLQLTVNKRSVDVAIDGTRHVVEVDGKSVARTSTLARQWVQANIPFANEDVLMTTVYIDGRSGHPLVTGTSAERTRFFTKFFGVDRFDIEKNLIGKEASALRTIDLKFKELLREYRALKDQVDDLLPAVEIESQLSKIENRLSKVQRQQEAAQSVNRVLSFIEANKDAYSTLSEYLPDDGTTGKDPKSVLKNALRDLDSKIEGAELQHEQYAKYRAWKEAKDVYDDYLSKIDSSTKGFLEKGSLDRALKVSKKRYEDLQSKKEAYSSLPRLSKPKDPGPAPADVGSSVEDLRLKIRDLEHSLDHASQFGSGTCPTCKQEVKLESTPRQMKRKLAHLNVMLESALKLRAYEEQSSSYKTDLRLYSKNVKERSVLKAEIDKLEKYRTIYLELRDLPEDPGSDSNFKLKKPGPKLAQLHRIRGNLQVFVGNLEFVEQYRSLNKETTSISDLNTEITDLNEKRSKLMADLEVRSILEKRLKEMRVRLRSYKDQLKNKPSLDLLGLAYNGKSMKKMAIQALAQHLTNRINQYSKLVFQEPFRFEVLWTGNALQVLVHRRSGKRILTTDVRKLSGAESKLFTLVLVLSLLTFRPVSQRASVLILDEPTANMSEESVDLFKDFLQVLMNVVPSVLIVTPRSNEHYEGARQLTVVKGRHGSRLVNGHPYSIANTNQ